MNAESRARQADTPIASTYTPLSPTRVLDTRHGAGGISGPVGPGGVVTLDLAGRLPTTATAVVFNLTGTEPTAPTFVTAFPRGQSRPTASNLNLRPNETRANLVTVAVGADRALDLYNHLGNTHLIADLAGYYSTGTGSKFLPLEPERELDLRVGPGSTTELDLTSSVPESATAAVLNVTAASATQDTFVTAWPAGSPRPISSTVNVPAGGVNPNLATVALGPGRKVNLYNLAGQLDLIVDIQGFYTEEFGAVFTPMAPVRLLDTRDGTGVFEGRTDPIPALHSRAVQTGWAVPDEAIGAVFNLTGIDATAPTHLSAWQADHGFPPSTSNLNLSAGQTAANLAVVTLRFENPNTRFYLFNNSGNTHVAADLAGYFWAPKTPCTDGCAYVWGSNLGGLGIGTTNSRSLPVPLGLSGVVAVSDSFALLADGSVWGWGRNDAGNFGTDWVTGNVPFPVRVAGLTGTVAIADTYRGATAYALRNDGTVWAWGSNAHSELGAPDDPSGRPVQVTGLTGVTAIAANSGTGYALRNDGTVWAWGWNNDGQLGNGSFATESGTPVQVTGLSNVTSIGAGNTTAYAVTADGAAWAWGSNRDGKLGSGSTAEFSRVPMRVFGLTGATAVTGGYNAAYAVRQDGTVWAWGSNWQGALGNGSDCSTCFSIVPVQVVDVAGAVEVTANASGGQALDTTGHVWAWGSNPDGELGTYLPSYRVRPAVIPNLAGVTALGDGGRALVPNP